jgi:hypothetical protein
LSLRYAPHDSDGSMVNPATFLSRVPWSARAILDDVPTREFLNIV